MKLALRIEPQQQGSLHAPLVAELERIAAQATDLDNAEQACVALLDGKWWMVGRGGSHVWLSLRTQYEPVRVAMIVEENARSWDDNALSITNARQADIVRGDIVRSYDFPGSRDDVYVEGVAKTVESHRVLIHVTREVWKGQEVQVERFEVWAPLGVSSLSGAPALFLIAKRVKVGA